MSWICPFLYLGTTLTSVINGMGKTGVTFLYTIISLIIKIGFLLFAVPLYGIRGYLDGLLFSQILLSFLEILYLRHYVEFHAISWIWISGMVAAAGGWCIKNSYPWLDSCSIFHWHWLSLGFACALFCCVYIGILWFLRIISLQDVH